MWPYNSTHNFLLVSKVSGKVVLAQHVRACGGSLQNGEAMGGKIVVVERGDCMFVEKARVVQSLGAVGGIVLDTTEGTAAATRCWWYIEIIQNIFLQPSLCYVRWRRGWHPHPHGFLVHGRSKETSWGSVHIRTYRFNTIPICSSWSPNLIWRSPWKKNLLMLNQVCFSNEWKLQWRLELGYYIKGII